MTRVECISNKQIEFKIFVAIIFTGINSIFYYDFKFAIVAFDYVF